MPYQQFCSQCGKETCFHKACIHCFWAAKSSLLLGDACPKSVYLPSPIPPLATYFAWEGGGTSNRVFCEMIPTSFDSHMGCVGELERQCRQYLYSISEGKRPGKWKDFEVHTAYLHYASLLLSLLNCRKTSCFIPVWFWFWNFMSITLSMYLPLKYIAFWEVEAGRPWTHWDPPARLLTQRNPVFGNTKCIYIYIDINRLLFEIII